MHLATAEFVRARAGAGADVAEVRDRARGTVLGAVLGDALAAELARRGPSISWGTVRRGAGLLRYTGRSVQVFAIADHVTARHGRIDGVDRDTLARTMAWRWRQEPWRATDPVAERAYRRCLLGAQPARGPGRSPGLGGCAEVAAPGLSSLGCLDRPLSQVQEWAATAAAAILGERPPAAAAAAHATAVAIVSCGSRVLLHPTCLVEALQAAGIPLPLSAALDQVPAAVAALRRERCLPRPPSKTAISALPGALACFLSAPDEPEHVLHWAGTAGGSGPMASLAGALAGAHCGASTLPSELVRRLEDSPRAIALGDALAHRARLTSVPLLHLPVPPHASKQSGQRVSEHHGDHTASDSDHRPRP